MVKYIFSVNPGRSGSHYLSNVLSQIEGVCSKHEPYPKMNGKGMMNFLNGDDNELNGLMPLKIETIKKDLGENNCYVETSHLFIKGFGWKLPEYLPQEEIGLIILRREKKKVVESLFRIQTTPLSYHGRMWLMFPSMKEAENKFTKINLLYYHFLFLINRLIRTGYNPFRKFRIEKKLFKSYEKMLLNWYVDETYSQGEKFLKKFPRIKVFRTDLEKLNNLEEYKKMFQFFDLEFKPKDSFFKVLNQKTNLKR